MEANTVSPSSELLALATHKAEERARARHDRLYLANEILGYDFQPCVHAELFDQYPAFLPIEEKPWVAQSDVKDIMVLWPRGHYKSTAVVVVCIQAILNNPDIRILLMQGSRAVTRTLLHQIYSHFDGSTPGSRLAELFPEFCGTKRLLQATQDSFITPARIRKQLAQATVTVASPKSIKTGQHYDLGIFDDLVNDQNYRNPKLLQKIQEDFTNCQPLIDPGCYRFVSGTRYAFGDLYEQILRWNTASGKWTVSVKNCWTDDGQGVRFPQCSAKDGRLIGFTREMLEQMQREDPAMFACQYLNQPVHSSLQAFNKPMLQDALIMPNDAPALSMAMLFIDLASTDAERSDDSVILCGKTDTLGNMYVPEARGGQWTPHQLALNVLEMALKHRPIKILFEKTASCIYFVDFLRLIAREKNIVLPIDYIKVNTQPDAKNIRVTALSHPIKAKRLRFFAGMACWDKMVAQFCEFPKGRYGHDDYPDTVALMVQYLGREMLCLPYSRPAINPILALIRDRENALISTVPMDDPRLTEADQTGFE